MLDILNDRLKTLPKDQVIGRCNELIAFWHEEQLSDSFPEIIDLCEGEIDIYNDFDI